MNMNVFTSPAGATQAGDTDCCHLTLPEVIQALTFTFAKLLAPTDSLRRTVLSLIPEQRAAELCAVTTVECSADSKEFQRLPQGLRNLAVIESQQQNMLRDLAGLWQALQEGSVKPAKEPSSAKTSVPLADQMLMGGTQAWVYAPGVLIHHHLEILALLCEIYTDLRAFLPESDQVQKAFGNARSALISMSGSSARDGTAAGNLVEGAGLVVLADPANGSVPYRLEHLQKHIERVVPVLEQLNAPLVMDFSKASAPL